MEDDRKQLTTADKITAIVRRYESLPDDYRDIDALTKGLRKLACALYDYAAETGELYRQSKGTEYARKTAYERERLRLIGEGEAVARAEIKAKEAVENALFQEVEADAEYKAASLQLSAARDVLEAMRQHIASLKTEKRLEMTGASQQ